jgi:hypothetical protein
LRQKKSQGWGTRPDDFDTAHEMMEAEKGPNGLVPYNVLLEIWREILCGGGK